VRKSLKIKKTLPWVKIHPQYERGRWSHWENNCFSFRYTPMYVGKSYIKGALSQEQADTPPLVWGRVEVLLLFDASNRYTPTRVGKRKLPVVQFCPISDTPPLAWGREIPTGKTIG
jgi:hypothetical protein